jgi:hypothetical protein
VAVVPANRLSRPKKFPGGIAASGVNHSGVALALSVAPTASVALPAMSQCVVPQISPAEGNKPEGTYIPLWSFSVRANAACFCWVAKFAAKDIGRRARAPLEPRKLSGVRIC